RLQPRKRGVGRRARRRLPWIEPRGRRIAAARRRVGPGRALADVSRRQAVRVAARGPELDEPARGGGGGSREGRADPVPQGTEIPRAEPLVVDPARVLGARGPGAAAGAGQAQGGANLAADRPPWLAAHPRPERQVLHVLLAAPIRFE